MTKRRGIEIQESLKQRIKAKNAEKPLLHWMMQIMALHELFNLWRIDLTQIDSETTYELPTGFESWNEWEEIVFTQIHALSKFDLKLLNISNEILNLPDPTIKEAEEIINKILTLKKVNALGVNQLTNQDLNDIFLALESGNTVERSTITKFFRNTSGRKRSIPYPLRQYLIGLKPEASTLVDFLEADDAASFKN